MPTTLTTDHPDTRSLLLDRRRHLDAARRREDVPGLEALLQDVDAALDRLAHGTYGVCEVCHDHIGGAHLAHDPTARCCVEHPTPSEATRLERDLALARKLQLSLLPSCALGIPGWRYCYHYEPAREVGGDFCDVIPLPGRGETLMLVGDVAGKGVAASVLMSSLLASFRSLASMGLPAGDLLARVNNLFHASTGTSSYATVAAAALQADGIIDLYSAGHWPPLVRRGATTESVPVTSGLPLGLFAASSYAPTRVRLRPDETLLFYTDGAIDAVNDAGDEYTTDRLAGVLTSVGERDLDAVVSGCLRDVERFQNGQPPADDLTLLAIRADSASAAAGVPD